MQRQVQAGNDTIRIAGRNLSVANVTREQDLARFQSKITTGDYSYDSDPLISVWVLSSFIGGIGAEYLKAGVDDENYWTGNLETRYPSMLTLLPETLAFPPYSGGSGDAYPLGDYPASSPNFYAAFGTHAARWDNSTGEFVHLDDMLTSPTNKAVEYNDLFWVPLGNGGFATIDSGGNVAVSADVDAVAFCVWDKKLAALDTSGYVLTYAAGGSWSAPTEDMRIQGGAKPRNLLVYIDQQNEPTIHVVTSRDVWAFDPVNTRLVRTQLQYPRHPDQGLASAVWRGESMYVSVGTGIHAYNGGIISSIGPDGRYGLPASLRGRITDLEPEYNALIAVVEGKRVSDGAVQTFEVNPPTYRDHNETHAFRNYSARSGLYRFSGYGWHPIWVAPTAEGIPTWAFVSEADDSYRLWWGYAEKMYRQDLRVTFHNPKAGMEVATDRFAAEGRLTTGWYDAGMQGFDKLLSHIEITTTDVFNSGEPTGLVDVEYQTDNDTGWTYLGTASKIGRTIMMLNESAGEQSDTFSYGLRCRRVRLRITMRSSDPYLSPVVESVLLKFLKIPIGSFAWTFEVDLTQKEGFMGNGPEDTAQFLYGLITEGAFHEMIHRNRSYRVRIAQVSREARTGYDNRSVMSVSVVEVRNGIELLKEPPVGIP